jgi:adenylate kinase family enzyme
LQRVLIIGSGGSGKSVFARELAEILGLPVVHLDAHHWRPNWIAPAADEWKRTIESLCAEPRWIMDGNYGGTMDSRLACSDTVIFLDLPRSVCLWRVLKRQLKYAGRTRPEMAPGCPERFSLEFISWIWSYRKRRRPGVLARLAALGPAQRAIVLTSPRDVKRFMEEQRNSRRAHA